MPDRHKQTKSKYTADRWMPGAFEGETVTRRRFMTGSVHTMGGIAAAAFTLPGARLRPRPAVQPRAVPVADDRHARRLPGRHLRDPGVHDPSRGRRGRQDDRLRPQARPGDRYRARRPVQPVHRALLALHAPRLPGPLRARRRPLHLPVPRRRLRLPRHGLRRPAGPAARPLLHPDRGQHVQIGPRYSVNSELQRFSPRDPGQPLDGIGQYLYPKRFSTSVLPKS